MPQVGLEPTRTRHWLLRPAWLPLHHRGNKYAMAFDDNYNLKLLYNLAGGQPYRGRPTHVVPQAKFEISYPNIKSEFKLTSIPQYKK